MKKRFLLLLLLFLTGCTVDYNLEINNNLMLENISGTILKDEYEIDENDTSINLFYDVINYDQYPVLNSDDVYEKNIETIDDGVKYKFSYIYKNNFEKSRIINSCFENFVFEETDDYYYASLSGDFYCLYSNEVVINVNTQHAVLEHNADNVNNNVYTWIIDDDNCNINMTVSKKLMNNSNNVKSNPNYFRIVGFIILVVLSAITYFLYKKRNSDKI